MPKVSKKQTTTDSSRAIVYPEIDVKLCQGEDELQASEAKEILGWTEETKDLKFKNDFFVQDLGGAKVRCYNNVTNRPFYKSNMLMLKQEILTRKWTSEINGEPLIIGKTGLVLNGQHTLVALVLAAQEWETHKSKWKSYWKTEPTISKLCVFGVNEDDKTVNTMDTCKPRSLADVLYRSEHFAGKPAKDRKIAGKICDYAIRFLWHRTGASKNAFAPRRTHSESLDFLERHPKLLECVSYIQEEEDGNGSIANHISLGYASGLLYLMSASNSTAQNYYENDLPEESTLDLGNWSKATDFWVLLAGNSGDLRVVSETRKKLTLSNNGYLSHGESCALLCKAWTAYIQTGKVKQADLDLDYITDNEGIKTLSECPTVGGIDLGSPDELETVLATLGKSTEKPTKKNKKVVASKGKPAKKKATKKKSSAPKVGKMAGSDWKMNDTAWVTDEDGEHYFGILLDDPYSTPQGAMTVVKSTDGEWEVFTTALHLTKPA